MIHPYLIGSVTGASGAYWAHSEAVCCTSLAMQPRTRRILLTLLILALTIFFYGVFGRNTLLLSLGDETVTLSGPENSSFSVPFSSIASMELRESFSPGAAVDGGVKNHIRYGLWHNDEWGD